MPCNSDYLDPTGREIELQRAARLLLFCYRECGIKGITHALIDAAADQYCNKDYVEPLCTFLTNFKRQSRANFERFIYNGKRKQCRDLADWWDEHQKADKAREAEEARQRKKKAIRKIALGKLSNEERDALDL